MQAGQLIVLESTTYPGTTEEVMIPILEKENQNGLKAARGASSGTGNSSSPSRPSAKIPATPRWRATIFPRSSAAKPASSELARALYGSIFRRTVPVSSPAAAEMTKLLENIYRCVNIALVNELKMLCLRMGIDIWEVIDSRVHQAFRLSSLLSRPRTGRTLHSR